MTRSPVQEIIARYAAERVAIHDQARIAKRKITQNYQVKMARMRMEFNQIKDILDKY